MGKQTTKITIYHQGANGFERSVYDGCFWEDDQAAKIAKTGISSADSLYVSIPLKNSPNLEVNKTKDYIVKGEVDFEFDNTSQTTQSASLKTLKASYEVFTITTVSKKDHGSPRMHHWEVGGK